MKSPEKMETAELIAEVKELRKLWRLIAKVAEILDDCNEIKALMSFIDERLK